MAWDTRAVVKGYKEPAMRAFTRKVKEIRHHPTITEESPEHEPQSSGLARRSVQAINGIFRIPRSVLENRIGKDIPDDHPVFTWLVRHAASLHNRYQMGHDSSPPWALIVRARASRVQISSDRSSAESAP